MKKNYIWILLAVFPMMGKAQSPMPSAWHNYIETLAEDGNDELVDELMELFEECREEPLNVNDTSDGLSRLPFINDFQQKSLRNYIALYGQLLSLEELQAVAGFDSTTIALLRPLAVAKSIATPTPLSLKEILSHGRSNLVVGTSGTIEQARGYRESIYEGNNLRMMWRYYFKYKDRLRIQISGDKDPGEAFFTGNQKQGFDFYGYSVMMNDIGKDLCMGILGENSIYVKRLVLGHYHLQFGQGLTLWSGFGQNKVYGSNCYKHTQGIRPSGAFTEYGFLQGAATTISLWRHLDIALFYSYINRDATLPRGAANDSSIDWVQSIYNSGYHRTQTEIGKKGLLGEQLWGTHLEYHRNDLRIGMTGVATSFDKQIIPARYIYNDNAFNGSRNYNIGIDFAYRLRRILVFGETAICYNNALSNSQTNISPASLIGSEFVINNNHRISGLLRYYSPTYHNIHATALGQSSTPQNEIGGTLQYQGQILWGTSVSASADHFWFPHMKYLTYAPSSGCEYRIELRRPFRHIKGLTATLKYRYKEKGRNVTPTTMVDGAYLMEQTHRHQVQEDIEYCVGAWRWTTRVAYTHYHGDKTESCHGFLFYQDMQLTPQTTPLSIAARITLFNVDDYEARLYATESDFVYQYNGGTFQNEGFRLYLLLRYDINKYWNVGMKYGVTYYNDKETFGSGYDLIDKNYRQQWRIQIRWKW